MKKLELKGKLNLNKETIARLNNDQMNSIKGGVEGTISKEIRKSQAGTNCSAATSCCP